ncbi:QacE family quaternary ammonium compound efflux SMR transporter [Paenibacillus sp. LMG 31458]|jgi:paired small multidrug resistance pump|uniref:QacE family quaternary ammonium compound efflux SMR transporter n=1 Tax=Paenibacillus phytorum TaxID=2654977 RepID=A0ABX1XWD5_9BACL|nr:multidrug efflux SMR transporter [Paenibacillus phytorum]NOU72719.1 QacE family quaternary ammonium compound efflux SMR transporter [Paenibacillus phytorum]
MGWIFLMFAGMFEVVGVVGMNQINKAKTIRSFSIFIVGIVMSFALLSQAMKSLPMGTSYAVWTGIGTVGGAVVGMLYYGESSDWKRIMFIAMVLSAAVGLKLIS